MRRCSSLPGDALNHACDSPEADSYWLYVLDTLTDQAFSTVSTRELTHLMLLLGSVGTLSPGPGRDPLYSSMVSGIGSTWTSWAVPISSGPSTEELVS